MAGVDPVNMTSTVTPALVQEDRTNLGQILDRAIVLADGSSCIRGGQVKANARCHNVLTRKIVGTWGEVRSGASVHAAAWAVRQSRADKM